MKCYTGTLSWKAFCDNSEFGWFDGWMDGRMGGRVDGQTDGLDGCMDRRTGRWMNS